MTRQELIDRSEAYIRQVLKEHLPTQCRIFLYGSRARKNHRWNSDYDFWIDADIPRKVIVDITEQLEESFVPFKVDIVTTPQVKGRFAECIRKEATPWI